MFVSAFGVCGIWLSSAISQDRPVPRPCDVAVLDVSKVFEKNKSFQEEMERLKKEVEAFEVEMKQVGQEMVEKKKGLDALTPGTEEHRKAEEELARFNSEMQIKVASKRRDFLAREAVIYANHYRRIETIVAGLAAKNSIRLVLRFNQDPMNEKDRNSVLQAVNRPVVFQDQLDITDEVVDTLNRA